MSEDQQDIEFIKRMEKAGEVELLQLAHELDLNRFTFTPRECSWDVECYSGVGINSKKVIIEIKKRNDNLDMCLYFGPFLMHNKYVNIMHQVKHSKEPIIPLFFNFSLDGLLIFEILEENQYQWKNLLLPKGNMRRLIDTRINQKVAEQYNPLKIIRYNK